MFQNTEIPIEARIWRIKCHIQELDKVLVTGIPGKRNRVTGSIRTVGWYPSPRGKYKLNTDGSHRTDETAMGAGGVLRELD